MSFTDRILASTVGVAYRAWTGNIDPYTLRQITAETKAGIAKAGSGLNPQQVAAQLASAERDIQAVLNANDANPLNPDGSLKAGLRIPGFGVVGSAAFLKKAETVVFVALGLMALGAITYFSIQIRRVFASSK